MRCLLSWPSQREISYILKFSLRADSVWAASCRHPLTLSHRTLTSFTGRTCPQKHWCSFLPDAVQYKTNRLSCIDCTHRQSLYVPHRSLSSLCASRITHTAQLCHSGYSSKVLDITQNIPQVSLCQTNTMAMSSTASAPQLSPEDKEMQRMLREIFQTAVESVMPQTMMETKVHFDPNLSILTVEDRSYTIKRNVFVVGFGKAVLGMARKLEDQLGDHIIKGILSIPVGAREDYEKAGRQNMLLTEGSKICVQEGAAHNLPDKAAYRAARDIHKLVSNLTANDIVIVLMSGGGSALLPYPVEPLDIDDIQKTTRELFSRGATVEDVNSIRIHLELLKGGGLAKAAMPAQVISLIISDVIGDSLGIIASGPTVRQTYAPQRCMDVLKRLKAREAIPQKALTVLEGIQAQPKPPSYLTSHPRGGVTYNPKGDMDSTDWSRVHNVIVGSNAICCAAAVHCAEQLGFLTCVLSHELSGEAKQVGQTLAKLAHYISASGHSRKTLTDKHLVMLELDLASQGIKKDKLNEISSVAAKAHRMKKPVCIVAGGETVVNITGPGKGGRNQEMVLAAGIQLQKEYDVLTQRRPEAEAFFLSAGTDGQDGPTEAAGALVDENFVLDAKQQGLKPELFLQRNDSFNLWSQFAVGRNLVTTGLTGTNVMDIQLMVVKTSLD